MEDNKLQLLETWKKACAAYYGDGESIMPDVEFDALTDRLREFNDPDIDKVLNGITNDITGETLPVNEQTVMLSLKKVKMHEKDALQKVFRFLGFENVNKYDEDCCVYAPKYDGMSIKVEINDDGNVTRCLTRGGMDVTDKLAEHPDVKNLSSRFPGLKTVHGELLIKKTTFKKFFDNEDSDYTSIRNCVPGILKTRDPLEIDMLLDFVPCTDGVNPIGDHWKKITDRVTWNRVDKIFEDYSREDFPYQVDGVVVGFHEPGKQKVKDNYPLNLVALKFKTISKRTRITGVTWSQKKTGKLVPVYDIAPVELNGVTCTHANGYNYEMMVNKRCGIGAEVTIVKTGEIIPVVNEVIQGSENYMMPDVEYFIDGINLVAMDKESSRKYMFYLGLKVFQINGIGNNVANMIGSCCDYDIIELFNPVTKPKVYQVLGGGATWKKFEEFYSIKTLHLDVLIEIMQFENCGKIVSRRIAELMTKQTTNVKGINKETLKYMLQGDGMSRVKKAMSKLNEYGIKTLKPVLINESTLTFEMSNPPKSGITKDEFVKQLTKKYPNATHTTLTKNTKYLFCDDVNANTGKILKARKYNIIIMTYEEALKRDDL